MKTIGLNPTIYAFGFAVPSWIRWPMMYIAVAIMGLTIPTIATIVITPVAVLAIAVIGAVLTVLKFYFRRAPQFQPST
jgi:uncharacterized membrane-anchored protein